MVPRSSLSSRSNRTVGTRCCAILHLRTIPGSPNGLDLSSRSPPYERQACGGESLTVCHRQIEVWIQLVSRREEGGYAPRAVSFFSCHRCPAWKTGYEHCTLSPWSWRRSFRWKQGGRGRPRKPTGISSRTPRMRDRASGSFRGRWVSGRAGEEFRRKSNTLCYT